MPAFDDWVEETFKREGVKDTVLSIIKLYEQTPLISRSDPIRALRDAYNITNRKNKVQTLSGRDEKIRALDIIQQQLWDYYETTDTGIIMDEYTPLSEIGKFICKVVNAGSNPCIKVEKVAEYVRNNSSDTLSVLRFLTGYVLGSNMIMKQEECTLMVNIAALYVMSLRIPIILNPDFQKVQVLYQSDIYSMGSKFFVERSIDSVDAKNTMMRLLSNQFKTVFGIVPTKLFGISEDSYISELLDSAKSVLLQTEPAEAVEETIQDVKTSKEVLVLSMLSTLMYRYAIEHDFDRQAINACYTYGGLLMTKHGLNVKLNTKLTVGVPAFV